MNSCTCGFPWKIFKVLESTIREQDGQIVADREGECVRGHLVKYTAQPFSPPKQEAAAFSVEDDYVYNFVKSPGGL